MSEQTPEKTETERTETETQTPGGVEVEKTETETTEKPADSAA